MAAFEALELATYDASASPPWKLGEGAARLAAVQERLCVVSIVGRLRDGKSQLLNMLAGRSVFPVAHTVTPCTKGLLAFVSDVRPDGSRVLYLDTEGMLCTVRQDANFDARIFIICVLLSTSLMFHTKGVVGEDMLRLLQCVTEMASLIVTSESEVPGARRGDPGFERFFPHLIFVLRDFTLGLEGRSLDQYIEELLEPTDGLTEEAMRADVVRRVIRRSFPSRKCAAFPVPTWPNGPELMPHFGPDFQAQLAALRAELERNMRPKAFASGGTGDSRGLPATGASLVAYLRLILDAFNTPGRVLRVPDLWQAASEQATRQALEAAKLSYQQFVEGCAARLPMEAPAFAALCEGPLSQRRAEAIRQLVASTACDHTMQEAAVRELHAFVAEVDAKFERTDMGLSKQRCDSAIAEPMQRLAAMAEQQEPPPAVATLEQEWHRCQESLQASSLGRALPACLDEAARRVHGLIAVLGGRLKLGEVERKANEDRARAQEEQRRVDEELRKQQREAEQLRRDAAAREQALLAMQKAAEQREKQAAADLEALAAKHRDEMERARQRNDEERAGLEARLSAAIEKQKLESTLAAAAAAKRHEEELADVRSRMQETTQRLASTEQELRRREADARNAKDAAVINLLGKVVAFGTVALGGGTGPGAGAAGQGKLGGK